MKRQCFVCDEDLHWYLIDLDESDLFEKLLYKEDDFEEFNDKFYDKRLNMHISNYSFENCKEIK
jgi:hypothetical protein